MVKSLRIVAFFGVALALGFIVFAAAQVGGTSAVAQAAAKEKADRLRVEQSCAGCHQRGSPSIVLDWKNGVMGRSDVTCADCHEADRNEPDAFQCSGLKGTEIYITMIPTPKDCSRCHPAEVEQFAKSDHAGAYKSVERLRGMSVEWEGKGSQASEATGCIQCHGGVMEFEDGRPKGLDYPQEGVGRLNADGSVGNCAACHTRHKFSVVEARKAQTCGSCHLGPDHPQMEIWEESKHGKRYLSEGDSWTWDSAADEWEPGDYSAPTCAVCHMSGIGALKTSHDVSQRLSWEAERPLSVRTENWKAKRQDMQSVCLNCHGKGWVEAFYAQYDEAIKLYNEEYYKPAKRMMDELYEKGLITKDNKWDDEIEIVFYYLWHHEGRRARMGAAMMGQDYAHWHGFFELAQDLDKMKREYERLKGGKRR